MALTEQLKKQQMKFTVSKNYVICLGGHIFNFIRGRGSNGTSCIT